MKKSVLISGANGLLGESLCHFFAKQGWAVRGFVRDLSQNLFSEKNISLFDCSLPEHINESAFEGIDFFIHCAYTTHFTHLKEAKRVNEEGTKKLYALCQERGIRFVFISSTSAHEKARSYYGKSKFKLEQIIDKGKDLVIKPGLILANSEKGIFGRIKRAISNSPILPQLGGEHSIVQTIHIDDLCMAILLALSKKLTGKYVVAEPQGLPVKTLWKLVSQKVGKKRIFIPLPFAPFIFIAYLFEHLKIRLPFSSENLLGLKYPKVFPSEKDLQAIGITVTSAAESIDRLYENTSHK